MLAIFLMILKEFINHNLFGDISHYDFNSLFV